MREQCGKGCGRLNERMQLCTVRVYYKDKLSWGVVLTTCSTLSKALSMLVPELTKTIRMNLAKCGYSPCNSSARKSVNSPANSTPVGPPPTTANVSNSLNWSSVVLGREASSKLSRILVFILRTSSISLMNEQCSTTPARPKSFTCKSWVDAKAGCKKWV